MNKIHRLTSTRAFDYVRKRGKSVANTNLVLICAPTKYALRVGFSVSKKVGKAVVRNKTKRRLKEGFRLLLPHLDQRFNYVFIARNTAAECDYHVLLGSMKHLLYKSGMIINKDEFNAIKW